MKKKHLAANLLAFPTNDERGTMIIATVVEPELSTLVYTRQTNSRLNVDRWQAGQKQVFTIIYALRQEK